MKMLMTKALLLAGTALMAATLPTIAQTKEPLIIVTPLATPVHMPFDVSMFVAAQYRIHLAIDRDSEDPVYSLLLDGQQRVVYTEQLSGKRLSKYRRNFNFEGAEGGVYSMQIRCKGQQMVHSFEMKIPGNPQQNLVEPQRYKSSST